MLQSEERLQQLCPRQSFFPFAAGIACISVSTGLLEQEISRNKYVPLKFTLAELLRSYVVLEGIINKEVFPFGCNLKLTITVLI